MWSQHDGARSHVDWQVTQCLISIILIARLIVLVNKPQGGGNTSHAPQPLLVGHVKDIFYQQISQTRENPRMLTFWNVMLYSEVTRFCCFKEMYLLHLQGLWNPRTQALKMKRLHSLEISGSVNSPTQCNISEDQNPCSQCCGNLKHHKRQPTATNLVVHLLHTGK